MARFLALGLAMAIGALAPVAAYAADAVLSMRLSRDALKVDGPPHFRPIDLTELDLVFGIPRGRTVPISLPTDGVRFHVAAGEPEPVWFELVAPAQGFLVRDRNTTTLSLAGQVAIMWHPGQEPTLYDVTLSAEPRVDEIVHGELEIRVEGRLSDSADDGSEPAFSGILGGLLQTP